MAINVNKVYRVVLSILNKESRGLLKPDQFNRFGRQAQLDLLDKSFYDYSRFINKTKSIGANTEYGDIPYNIQEKIDYLAKEASLSFSLGTVAKPSDLYKIISIHISSRTIEVENVKKSKLIYLNASKLTSPTSSFPVFYVEGENIKILPSTIPAATIDYIKVPADPIWAFTGGGASAYVYDINNSTNFELHPSEEVSLVTKILSYSGVMLKDPLVIQTAASKETNEFNTENIT